MSKFAIPLLTLSMYAAALVLVPVTKPAEAASHGKHVKKYKNFQRSFGFENARDSSQAWPATRASGPAGPVCPGLARSFDCKIWPPPYDEDPDRKVSGSDGG